LWARRAEQCKSTIHRFIGAIMNNSSSNTIMKITPLS
jgi:hypothetical protein